MPTPTPPQAPLSPTVPWWRRSLGASEWVGIGVLVAIAAVVIAVLDSRSPVPPPPPPPPSSSPPPPSPSSRPLVKEDLATTCRVDSAPKPGLQLTLTYTIVSKAEGKVDLGAEVYADDGNALATGFGDLHGYPIKAGTHTVSRPLQIPVNLGPGNYEIIGELWPEGLIGNGDTLSDPTCATFSVS